MCLLVFSACDNQQEQIHDDTKYVAPVLTIEGTTNFVITEELPVFYYTVLTWSRANFGKGVSVEYVLQVANDESFTGSSQSVYLGTDTNMRALTATELYGWAVDDFGIYNNETERIEPATLFFRILSIPPPGVHIDLITGDMPIYSNTVSITSTFHSVGVFP
jgi:hypothetical protein